MYKCCCDFNLFIWIYSLWRRWFFTIRFFFPFVISIVFYQKSGSPFADSGLLHQFENCETCCHSILFLIDNSLCLVCSDLTNLLSHVTGRKLFKITSVCLVCNGERKCEHLDSLGNSVNKDAVNIKTVTCRHLHTPAPVCTSEAVSAIHRSISLIVIYNFKRVTPLLLDRE